VSGNHRLDRAAILGFAPLLLREDIEVPGWGGGTVGVRAMNAMERDRFETALLANKRTNFRGLLAAFTLCDEEGKRICTEQDAEFLAGQSAAVLEPIIEAAIRLNKLSPDDVRDMEKNSPSSPSSGS
jgi:hypothetical protein